LYSINYHFKKLDTIKFEVLKIEVDFLTK